MGTQAATGPYICWDAPGVEVVGLDEAATNKAISDQFNHFQDLTAEENHHAFRGTHVKTQGCVMGTLEVKADLPPHLRQGLFKATKTHDVIMRYSSLTPRILPDTIPAPRAIGIKVFGVEGPKLFHEDFGTQDFVLNNYPYCELSLYALDKVFKLIEIVRSKVTHDIAGSIGRNWNNPGGLVEELKARPDAALALATGGLPQEHPVAMDQHSQSAYRYGDYVAKFAVFPVGEKQKELKSWRIRSDDPSDIISKSLATFHADNTATYSFCVQLLRDLADQPVEDIGITWDPIKYPFEEVATLKFEPQDSNLPAFKSWWWVHRLIQV
ncbi:hypothetical protein RQP46_004243 [Phenoliferia psychrophenolica]